MQMVSAGYSHLVDKYNIGELSGEVLQKLNQLISELQNRNFTGASTMQTVS